MKERFKDILLRFFEPVERCLYGGEGMSV